MNTRAHLKMMAVRAWRQSRRAKGYVFRAYFEAKSWQHLFESVWEH